jgi:hypothetical protein
MCISGLELISVLKEGLRFVSPAVFVRNSSHFRYGYARQAFRLLLSKSSFMALPGSYPAVAPRAMAIF